MVGANTFRLPTVVAREVTTLDHISGGRAVLGIGGAWFETEHDGLGIEFGSSPGERLRWLAEAVPIMRGMLDGTSRPGRASTTPGSAQRAAPDPGSPAHPRGRRRERKTLRIVAQWADACNLGGGFESVKRKDEILRRHCEEVGRDESEIERTLGAGAGHPGRPGRGPAGPGVDLRPQRARTVAQPADRHARSGRGAPATVPDDRVPAPRLRLSVAVRRGDDGAADHRGEADARRV